MPTTSFSDYAATALVGFIVEGVMTKDGPDVAFTKRLKRQMHGGLELIGPIIDEPSNTAADYRIFCDLDVDGRLYLGVLDRLTDPYYVEPLCLARAKVLARTIRNVCAELEIDIVVTHGRHPKFS